MAALGGNVIPQEGHRGGAPQPGSAPVRSRASIAALGGVIAAIWLVALSRWITTDTVVPWDSKNQFFAFFRFLATALHSGATPFWNPYHYGGHPSVADPQSLVLSPVFVLWALLDPTPSLRSFDVIVYAHLLAGGLAICAIGWRARWPLSACVLTAVIFMLGGAAAGRLQHTGIILSYALFPPALLLLQLALARRSRPRPRLRFRGRTACARAQPGRAVALLSPRGVRARRNRDRRAADALPARTPGGARDHGARRDGARRCADAADLAVHRALQPPGRSFRRGDRGIAPPGQSRDPRGRRPVRDARAELLGTGRADAARGAVHRRLVQLPVRRRRDDDAVRLVRPRRRRRVPARPHSARGGARPVAPLHARPLHAVLSARLRLVAGRQPVPPPGRRELRLPDCARAPHGAPAGRLRARRAAAASPRAEPVGGRWLFSARTGHAGALAMAALKIAPLAALPAMLLAAAARTPRMRALAAVAFAAIVVGRGGVLTLHGNYYPGWIAEVDRDAQPILRAKVLFGAVEVPPGRRRVVFRYAPFSLENLKDALNQALSR